MITQLNIRPPGKKSIQLEQETPLNIFRANFRRGSIPAGFNFVRASNAGYFSPSGQWALALTNTPRFDHDPANGYCKGLFMEESRTNYLRNNTMAGAVAGVIGASGALPTYWGLSGQGTLTLSLSSGADNGMEYLDLTLQGTTSTTALILRMEQTTAIAASISQLWVASAWLKLVNGSANGVSTSLQLCSNSGPQTITNVQLKSVLSRESAYTTMPTGTTRAYSQLELAFQSGQELNLTLRIALPQLERGANPSSMIKTSGIAATRSADLMTLHPLGNWYASKNGTMLADAIFSENGYNSYILTLSNNTVGHRMSMRSVVSTGKIGFGAIAAGTVQASLDTYDWNLNKRYRLAASWSHAGSGNTNFSCAVNGVEQGLATSTMPTVTHLDVGRAPALANSYFNGWLQEVAIMPHSLSRGELTASTTL